MHRRPDGNLIVSATDFVGFLECGHLTQLERALAAGLVPKPHLGDDPALELLRRRGAELTLLPRLGKPRPAPLALGTCGAVAPRPARRFRGRGGPPPPPSPGTRNGLFTPPPPHPKPPAPFNQGLHDARLALRGRRHQARPQRQGQRADPDLQLRRADRAHPGRPAGQGLRRHGRREDRDPPLPDGRDDGLLPPRQAAL